MTLKQNHLDKEQGSYDIPQLSSAISFFVKNLGSTFAIQNGFLLWETVSVQGLDNNTICIKFSSIFDNISIYVDHNGQFLNATNKVIFENYSALVEVDSDFAKLFIFHLHEKLERSSPHSNSGESIGNIQKNIFVRIFRKLLKLK